MSETVAAIEIDHVTCTAEGAPVMSSTDIFLPRSIDLHVMRWLEDVPPVPAIGRRAPVRAAPSSIYKFAQSGDIVAARRAAGPRPSDQPEEDA